MPAVLALLLQTISHHMLLLPDLHHLPLLVCPRGNNEEFLSRTLKYAQRKKWSHLLAAYKTALAKLKLDSPAAAAAATAAAQQLEEDAAAAEPPAAAVASSAAGSTRSSRKGKAEGQAAAGEAKPRKKRRVTPDADAAASTDADAVAAAAADAQKAAGKGSSKAAGAKKGTTAPAAAAAAALLSSSSALRRCSWGSNPTDSILSASSKTTRLVLSRQRAPLSIRSSRRPGVATSSWGMRRCRMSTCRVGQHRHHTAAAGSTQKGAVAAG